ncbi:MAG: hypothetical protein NTY95_17580, partial [Bacteroidia bacterium]|nr:hypothetical protein [Bacteroidia bacterium]
GNTIVKATILMLTVIILILSITLGFLIFKLEYKPLELPEETAIELARNSEEISTKLDKSEETNVHHSKGKKRTTRINSNG